MSSSTCKPSGSELPHAGHALTAHLSVPELYIVLGYAWYMGATSTGQVMAAHNRIAKAAKSALREAGEPDQRICEKL